MIIFELGIPYNTSSSNFPFLEKERQKHFIQLRPRETNIFRIVFGHTTLYNKMALHFKIRLIDVKTNI